MENNKINFIADSDAFISKGMVTILCDIYSDREIKDIVSTDFNLIKELDLDILLTHCPIDGLHKDNFSGDHLLRKRLEQMKNPPKIHCFGHSHNTFGVYERKNYE